MYTRNKYLSNNIPHWLQRLCYDKEAKELWKLNLTLSKRTFQDINWVKKDTKTNQNRDIVDK